ncbi:MAG TPA: transcriptional regulator NrdR [Rhodospirillaceae bacterium]|nr:transcriptional regulator NrdR [Rhodospirillaceae bacterium]
MKCPFCGSPDTQVKDSRPSEDGASIRRRRQCDACGARFTTFERVQLRELIVIKSDGEKELFERDKLLRSLQISLRKRPVEQDHIDRTVNAIVRQLEALGESEIKTAKIGQFVMEALAKIDQVAYVRYASVYKDFREAQDFNEFLETLKPEE